MARGLMRLHRLHRLKAGPGYICRNFSSFFQENVGSRAYSVQACGTSMKIIKVATTQTKREALLRTSKPNERFALKVFTKLLKRASAEMLKRNLF